MVRDSQIRTGTIFAPSNFRVPDFTTITFTLSKRLELNKVHRSGITHTSQHRPNYLDLLNLKSNIEFLLD